MNLDDYISKVPDFPKPGILFLDISPLLVHGQAMNATINQVAALIADFKPDVVAGIESRGFILASAVAHHLECGVLMIRKKGKLPAPTVSRSYGLEYGNDVIEIPQNLVKPGQRVVILDDVLATGGTMKAAVELLQEVGASVCATACLIEIKPLNGRAKIETSEIPFSALLVYGSNGRVL